MFCQYSVESQDIQKVSLIFINFRERDLNYKIYIVNLEGQCYTSNKVMYTTSWTLYIYEKRT